MRPLLRLPASVALSKSMLMLLQLRQLWRSFLPSQLVTAFCDSAWKHAERAPRRRAGSIGRAHGCILAASLNGRKRITECSTSCGSVSQFQDEGDRTIESC